MDSASLCSLECRCNKEGCRTAPPGWKSIPGLLKSFTNTGSGLYPIYYNWNHSPYHMVNNYVLPQCLWSTEKPSLNCTVQIQLIIMVFYTKINTEAVSLPPLLPFSDKGKFVPVVHLGVGTIHHRVPTPTPFLYASWEIIWTRKLPPPPPHWDRRAIQPNHIKFMWSSAPYKRKCPLVNSVLWAIHPSP